MGKESVIVEKIGYDKDGHTVYTKLGNGTETTYSYDKQRERLQSMLIKSGSDSIMANQYTYDAVDNILSIANSASGKSGLGGKSTHNYTYDMLNRLSSASGSAKDIKYTMSMTFGKMSEPLTKVLSVDSTSVAKSYNLAYKYESAEHPTAPTQIGHEHYTYDANGNPILVENDSTSTTREMFWDEDNRLMVLSDNGKTSRYTYNAGGERIIKSHGSMEGVYINGAPQGITFHETDEFTLYPASIITVNRHRFTKHYFIGDKRVASRIGQGEFRNVYGSNGSNVTAGQQDYAERMNAIENQREDYYRAAGVAPGLPTMKGSYADPEVTGKGYNVVIKELGDHRVPENWVQHPVINTEEGTNPGAPLAWGSPENPDDVVAGYGYVPCDTSEVEETFYYHSDHLGSTAYITDQQANVTQYDAYLPYGELLVDEHSSSADLPYKFNGKELDEETGLYYYGARYMNPVTSMWYGVDPLAEKYVLTGSYVYCVGNPIKLVDPDGQKIRLWGSNETRQKLLGLLQKLTRDRLSFDKDGYVSYKAVGGKKYNIGTYLIRLMVGSKYTANVYLTNGESKADHYIKGGAGAVDGTGTNCWININPNQHVIKWTGNHETMIGTKEEAIPDYIIAGHELIHGLRMMKGVSFVSGNKVNYKYVTHRALSKNKILESIHPGLAEREELETVGILTPSKQGMISSFYKEGDRWHRKSKVTFQRATNALFTENALRLEHGLPARINYGR